MSVVELGFAFAAGLAMIASPCVLMLLPILLGTSLERSSRPVFIILGFIVAFALVALVFAKGAAIAGLSPVLIRQLAIIMLALFAVLLLWPAMYTKCGHFLQPVSDAGTSLVPAPGAGKAGGFLLGMSLGAVWTPCSGPILASIIALVAGAQTTEWGLIMLLSFGAGTALPMLLVAYGGRSVSQRLAFVARNNAAVRRVFGVATLILVAYMQWQQFAEGAQWVANKYQGWL